MLQPAGAKVFLTQEEALKLAFPDAEVERKSLFLSNEQMAKVKELSRTELRSGIAQVYIARKDGKVSGYAYFDTHIVRTFEETLMIVLTPEAKVRRIEVISFREPEEYIAREEWYAQYYDKGLSKELSLQRGIRPITGATLTAEATNDSVRRVLALHKVTQPSTEDPQKAKKAE